MEFLIKLSDMDMCYLLTALDYTIDKYDLYKKEKFVEDLKKIRNKIENQNIKQMWGNVYEKIQNWIVSRIYFLLWRKQSQSLFPISEQAPKEILVRI